MKICICDDEKIISEELKNIIEDISFEIDEDIIINQFYSGKELIDNISNKNEKYDIIFLDILMSNLNGIETSKYIRKIDNSVNIVFLTSSSEFAINGYEVGALDYLLKPVDYKKIKKTIDKILANRELEDVFIFKSNNEIIKLPIKFINYFEVKNRIIYINSCSKIYNNKSFYQKLDNIEKELNNK
ncbi:TPA: response regulator transcription factor, partial [Clostridium perfringens]|nr:response regulator transcription factor [Clostridium perfringens]